MNLKRLRKTILKVGDIITMFALGVVAVCFLFGSFTLGLIVFATSLLVQNNGELLKIKTILEER